MLRRELTKGSNEVDDGLGHLVSLIGQCRRPAAAVLELACRDAEGHPPYPRPRISDPVAGLHGLSERLRHGVTSDVTVAPEQHERALEPCALIAVQTLELLHLHDRAQRLRHLSHIDRAKDRPKP